MNLDSALLLFAAGLVAGTVNTLAGGGSLLTVPALVLLGLPGTVANATNRVGVLASNVVAAWRFRAKGVSEFREALPVLLPSAIGSLVGALAISRIRDETFETLFGFIMLALLVPILRAGDGATPQAAQPRSRLVTTLVFFAVGIYGGAIQAGVGFAFVAGLSYAGYDLVRASAIKVVVIGCYTLVAVGVFAFQGQVDWLPACVLAVGFGLGGELGARIAVRGGERIIRVVVAVAVVVLAGRMLGLY